MIDDNSPQKAYEYLQSIKKSLVHKNRFNVDSKFDCLIDSYAREGTNIEDIKPDAILYRARIYNEPEAAMRYIEPPEGAFKGYSAEDSFVPPPEKVISDERCNPPLIPYLYTSTTEECCVAEMKPAKDTIINIAEIRNKESLKILRFDKDYHEGDSRKRIIDGISNVMLYTYMSIMFGNPYKQLGDYYLTQYISEKVKRLSFDGISYKSSMLDYSGDVVIEQSIFEQPNVNVTIFSLGKCEAISSRLVRVDVKIEFD